MQKRIKRNRVKIRYDRVFKCFLVIGVFGLIIYYFLNLKLTNIYITGNEFLKDQEIIELSSLQNYPKMIFIKNRINTFYVQCNGCSMVENPSIW